MKLNGNLRDRIAKRVAKDILPGSIVNLGIGLPTKVADYIDPKHEVIFHSENGVIGVGPYPTINEMDDDLINAGKELITLVPGGCFIDSVDSFDIMRGGHLDISVIGAFQVGVNGDLANWHTGSNKIVPAVGGAMDLAVGARNLYVCMEHTTKDGKPKIVENISYPITGKNCVNKIYTELCVVELRDGKAYLIDKIKDISFQDLQKLTECELIDVTEGRLSQFE